MPSAISVGLTKTVAELLLFGVYVVLFVAVIYFFRSGLMVSRNRPLVLELGIVMQFLSITAHLATSIAQAYMCLVDVGGGRAATLCFLNVDAPIAVADTGLFILVNVITDMLVYGRTTGGRSSLLCYSSSFKQAVGGIGVVVTLASGTAGRQTVLSLSNMWVATMLGASLVISVGSSGMIFWKISRMAREFDAYAEEINGGRTSHGMHALAIIIESAGIQTLVTVTLLVAFESGFMAAAVLTGIGPAVFGISTVLIHVRVGLGWATQKYDSASSRQLPPGAVRLAPLSQHSSIS
ncbi:hypothetical protein DFH06DRAFT_1383778 [Mycena polygramma]|nr:hypothetical protein DFH06DRAFT_1383778 [Mycena polygramma]